MLIGETAPGEATTISMTAHDNDEVAAHIEMDDYPVIAFRGEGDYEVAVIMCEVSSWRTPASRRRGPFFFPRLAILLKQPIAPRTGALDPCFASPH